MKESFFPEGITNGPLSLVDSKEDERRGGFRSRSILWNYLPRLHDYIGSTCRMLGGA